MSNAEFAARGVEAAKAFMERRDYEIEAVDWKCDAGQIDIVAFDPVAEMLVFAEVKRARTSTKAFLPKLSLKRNVIEWSASQ